MRTRTLEGFQSWLDEWVMQVPNRAAYLEKLGKERIRGLEVKEHRYAAPVDYGY
jgi:glutaconate CoA-transferase subunit A